MVSLAQRVGRGWGHQNSLDDETEREIVAQIRRLKGQITMIVIAHRLSTVQHCDRIYKLKEGRIVDQSNFDAMVNKKLFSADLQKNSGKKKF